MCCVLQVLQDSICFTLCSLPKSMQNPEFLKKMQTEIICLSGRTSCTYWNRQRYRPDSRSWKGPTRIIQSNYLISLGLTKLKFVQGIVQVLPQHWKAWGIDHLSRKPTPIFDRPVSKESFMPFFPFGRNRALSLFMQLRRLLKFERMY